MATLQERCSKRTFVRPNVRYYSYRGREHDLYISLPDYSELQRCFEIIFDKLGEEAPYIIFHKKRYDLTEAPMLTEDHGYYCIHGKFRGSKGLHKIPLHRLAYVAFYGQPPVGYHIHHIDGNKHNNAADNLVALTEGEHSTVHQRDVSVGRTLFTEQKPKRTLLSNNNLTFSSKGKANYTCAAIESLGAFAESKILMSEEIAILLSSEYTEKALQTVLAKIFDFRIKRIQQGGVQMTVLDKLYQIAKGEDDECPTNK